MFNVNRREKKIVKHMGYHLLTKRDVVKKKKKADGSEETLHLRKFVQSSSPFNTKSAAETEGKRLARLYGTEWRVQGVRMDWTPIKRFKDKDGGSEVTITRES